MKKLLLILFCLFLPLAVQAKHTQPRVLNEAFYCSKLHALHVYWTQKPQDGCKRIYQAVKRVDPRNLEDLTIWIRPGQSFTCGEVDALGCYYWQERFITVVDTPYGYSFNFVLLHEIGHSTGIVDEAQADQYARAHL